MGLRRDGTTHQQAEPARKGQYASFDAPLADAHGTASTRAFSSTLKCKLI
jgi:hypothetical protein